MKSKFNKLKREIMPFLFMFIIIDIIIIGSLNLAVVEAKNNVELDNSYKVFQYVIANFIPNITHFKFIIGIFKDFASFLNMTFYTFLVFVAMFIVWKIKFMKSSEYDGIENGSSDWAQNGEEFYKLEDGREILNKKSGFILSKKHYLGTDLRKVLINKNILVIGRIWCR